MSLLRRAILYVGAAGLLAAVASTLARPVAGPAPVAAPPPRVPVAPAAVHDTVRVAAVRGTVEQARGGSWRPLVAGAELRVDDSLRTAEGAVAELTVGERSRIEVAERSEMTVREITQSVHRFRIDRGRLSARYQPDGARVLRVEDDAGAIVETHGGSVGIVEMGAALAVAAESGTATLRAAGHSVDVGPGRLAVAPRDTPPATAEPIPVGVLLRLAEGAPLPGNRTARLRGTTSPGTRLRVNGVAADVDEAGRFRARIPLHQGENRIVAVVEDALGRKVRRTLPPIVIGHERRGPPSW
jgi:glucodextranase-like protein